MEGKVGRIEVGGLAKEGREGGDEMEDRYLDSRKIASLIFRESCR